MDAVGTAHLADEIPASRAVATVVPRGEIAGLLQDPECSPELHLDVNRGEERGTIDVSWTHEELEQLLARISGDDIVLTFDRDQLEWAFDDVEAHGLRQRALVFAVAAAGALGSGATIAHAAPVSDNGSSGATVGMVQKLAHDSIEAEPGMISNARTPGLQVGEPSPTVATPSVQVSAKASAGDFMGVPTRDVADGLIAGGLLLAIAGATFAGSRRMGTARPA